MATLSYYTAGEGLYTVQPAAQAPPATGNLRPDVLEQIFLATPLETPVTSAMAHTRASQVIHEWMYEALASPTGRGYASNREWTDLTVVNILPSRGYNVSQIIECAVGVDGTAQAVSRYGVADQYQHQLGLKMKEQARNIELAVLRGEIYNPAADSATEPRRMGGILPSNWTAGATYGAPILAYTSDAVGVRVNHGGAVMDEDAFMDVLQRAYDNGMTPETVVSSIATKRKTIMRWTTNQRQISAEAKQLIADVSSYDSPAGEVRWVLSRFIDLDVYSAAEVAVPPTYFAGQPDGTTTPRLIAMDKSFFKIADLRALTKEIGETGDNDKGMIIWEGTLEARSPYAAACADSFVLPA